MRSSLAPTAPREAHPSRRAHTLGGVPTSYALRPPRPGPARSAKRAGGNNARGVRDLAAEFRVAG